MAKHQRGGRELQTNALQGVLETAWRAVEQRAVLLIDQGVRVASLCQPAFQGAKVVGQRAKGTQQRAPGGVVLGPQERQRCLKIVQRRPALAILEGLAQADGPAECLAGIALLVEQSLAAESH